MTALEYADSAPVVSIVVPMLNELGHIERCLDGFAVQSYPLDRLDVVVVDGGSVDGCRRLVEARAQTCGWLRVVDNPRRKAAAAFNVGVSEAAGDIVGLFSAHGVPDADYITRSVSVLMETGAVGVGGRYLHVGETPPSSAIGLAMVSPFGMASPHRFLSERREVDTISHPVYVRKALLDIGPFDETLERNSDYELNYRLRQAGGRLVFDPSISSIYRPRPSLRALGRQFWWYGRWKERVVRAHPGSLAPRHLVAPAVTAVAVASPLIVLSGRPGRRLIGTLAGLYGALVCGAVVTAHPRQHDADPLTLAAAFPVMHAAWGAGFLASVVEDLRPL